MKKIGIVMGSDSDLPIIEKAINYLQETGVEFTVNVYSAHRTPDEAISFARNAQQNGYGVIIAAAGMAAHLAGVLAANTILPVIGIPCKSKALDGMDALLSTVMMPPGIPVATVGVDGAKNAAILACEILALADAELASKLAAQRAENTSTILQKNAEIAGKYSSVQ
ncbi:5-(carboxyamino)imidazole ribonucleotide mutase [Arcanobacterium hippocoleae]|uniref:5-(carboxyamino)imidazole ribonucleotide mutase n=1 Tax=Arcanobacterium hippocoleae TaxID=149017 RepID=UPI00360E4208